MKATVIITNYNYSQYIEESIMSVLKQDNCNELIENIVVVDDGSTDDSLKKIDKYVKNNKITLVKKDNYGQLSAFNYAKQYVKGEIVFFLDSDDYYKRNYLNYAINYYKNSLLCDFLIVERDYVNENGKFINKESKKIFHKKKYYGLTPIITYLSKIWIGGPTSCISMRKELLDKILPIPLEEDWKTRADDCLVWAASIKEGNKCYINEKFVNYRIHNENKYYGKKLSKQDLFKRNIAINRLFYYLTRDVNIHYFIKNIAFEFKILPNINFNDFKLYLKTVSKQIPNIILKVKLFMKIIYYFLVREK